MAGFKSERAEGERWIVRYPGRPSCPPSVSAFAFNFCHQTTVRLGAHASFVAQNYA